MKSLINFLIAKVHWIMILYTGYAVFTAFEEHQINVKNSQEQVPIVQRKIRRTRKKIKDAEKFLANLDASKKRVEEVASQIEAVQKQLPNAINDPEILDAISKEANLLNLKNVFLDPQREKKHGFYFSKNYSFKAVGTYLQLLVLFERIGKHPRIINTSTLEIRSHVTPKAGRFKLVELKTDLEVYRYNQSYREDRGIKEIENKFVKPEAGGKKRRKRRKRK